jgi:hypothetical protein
MFLKDKDHIEKINSMTRESWEPLLALIPTIEKTEKFQGDVQFIENDDEIIFNLCQTDEAEIVDKFRQAAYEIRIVIDFNWPAWKEGEEIVSNTNFDYDSIDIPTKCKIITAILRNDRFCEGVLASYFDSGLILKVLKSIQKQLERS